MITSQMTHHSMWIYAREYIASSYLRTLSDVPALVSFHEGTCQYVEAHRDMLREGAPVLSVLPGLLEYAPRAARLVSPGDRRVVMRWYSESILGSVWVSESALLEPELLCTIRRPSGIRSYRERIRCMTDMYSCSRG